MRLPRVIATIVGAVMLVGGCASPAPAAGLDGRSFLSTSVSEAGTDRPLVRGTRIRLEFAAGRLVASAGCNTLSGPYRIDEGRLVTDGLAMTELGCDPARHAQDQWLAAFLGSRPIVGLPDDTLELEADRVVVRLADREVVEPDLPLVGTVWRLSELRSGDAVSTVPQGVAARMEFGADGRFTVETGCNSGGGRFDTADGTLRFGDIALTALARHVGQDEVEAAVLMVLNAAQVAYEIEASRLTLDAGGVGLAFSGG